MTEYNGIKVGDLITSYWKGYFKLVKIIPRYKIDEFPYVTEEYDEGLESHSPIFVFMQKYKADGRAFNGKQQRMCDAVYCELAKNAVEKQLLMISEIKSRLEDIQKQC